MKHPPPFIFTRANTITGMILVIRVRRLLAITKASPRRPQRRDASAVVQVAAAKEHREDALLYLDSPKHKDDQAEDAPGDQPVERSQQSEDSGPKEDCIHGMPCPAVDAVCHQLARRLLVGFGRPIVAEVGMDRDQEHPAGYEPGRTQKLDLPNLHGMHRAHAAEGPRDASRNEREEVDDEEANQPPVVALRITRICRVGRLVRVCLGLREAVDECDQNQGRVEEQRRPDSNRLGRSAPPRRPQAAPEADFVIKKPKQWRVAHGYCAQQQEEGDDISSGRALSLPPEAARTSRLCSPEL
jgi:hypothetical protein